MGGRTASEPAETIGGRQDEGPDRCFDFPTHIITLLWFFRAFSPTRTPNNGFDRVRDCRPGAEPRVAARGHSTNFFDGLDLFRRRAVEVSGRRRRRGRAFRGGNQADGSVTIPTGPSLIPL